MLTKFENKIENLNFEKIYPELSTSQKIALKIRNFLDKKILKMIDKKPDINISNWNIDEAKENFDNLTRKMEQRIHNLDNLTLNMDKYFAKLNLEAVEINKQDKKDFEETIDITNNFPSDKTKFNAVLHLPIKEGSEFLKWISEKKEYEIKEFRLV